MCHTSTSLLRSCARAPSSPLAAAQKADSHDRSPGGRSHHPSPRRAGSSLAPALPTARPPSPPPPRSEAAHGSPRAAQQSPRRSPAVPRKTRESSVPPFWGSPGPDAGRWGAEPFRGSAQVSRQITGLCTAGCALPANTGPRGEAKPSPSTPRGLQGPTQSRSPARAHHLFQMLLALKPWLPLPESPQPYALNISQHLKRSSFSGIGENRI